LINNNLFQIKNLLIISITGLTK